MAWTTHCMTVRIKNAENKKLATIEQFDLTRKIHYEILVTPIFDEHGHA